MRAGRSREIPGSRADGNDLGHRIRGASVDDRESGGEGSCLKKPRVEAVVSALPQFEQGRSLSSFACAKPSTAQSNFFSVLAESNLNRLRRHWTGDAKAHGAGQQRANIEKQKQSYCDTVTHVQQAHRGPEHRRQMTGKFLFQNLGAVLAQRGTPETLRDRHQKGLTLGPAPPVGDVVGEE